ncbi:AIPR family protein [Myxococcus sp. AM010]|uniref:AIPR family protein n=1 Tax=Myxococcus sp. AM010 TaxID=2745138 RepID=UPI0015956C03|nr:AIPR family protein [Myxococcus sp. AM010]NVJ19163.1 AIPR family protein [Myxococcus sp. AM010]
MAHTQEVATFLQGFRDTVGRRLDEERHGKSGPPSRSAREAAFTRAAVEVLEAVGAVEELEVRLFDGKVGTASAKVNGYFVSEDGDRLDLAVSACAPDDARPDVPTRDVQRAVDLAWRFMGAALDGLHLKLDEDDPAYPMALRIHDVASTLEQVRLFVLIEGIAKSFRGNKAIRPSKQGTIEPRIHIYDIEKLARCIGSGRPRESIEVDFAADYGTTIPCLPVAAEGDAASGYLAVIPGDVLHRLYDEYGERLLELNVRSFLQARGQVNRGIRDTILQAPEQFFAFNNGLSAIAEEVRTERAPDGGARITWVRGLQIVNGGQTTASLHRAGRKDAADLSRVFVQAKLTVVPTSLVEEMVPRISRFANSQNKVNDADFSANEPYHLALERLSRSIWSPGGQTRWFYERARGQYQVARARRAGAELKEFERTHPAEQVFTKTDVATFIHCWEGRPHTVSLGAQKNFRTFAEGLARPGAEVVPDERYFQQLVARGILFRTCQQLAREMKIGAYRANVVSYSVAYLGHHAGNRVSLDRVWVEQRASREVEDAFAAILAPVEECLRHGADGRNVTEWCKREECWTLVRALDVPAVKQLGAAAAIPGKSMPRAGPKPREGSRPLEDLPALARALSGREVHDLRPTGAIWVIGGEELSAVMERVRSLGFSPMFCEDGTRASGGRPAWYVRSRP